MDGPEVIMDAEEYLQPKARGPLPSVKVGCLLSLSSGMNKS
jgi:hypothetical protein